MIKKGNIKKKIYRDMYGVEKVYGTVITRHTVKLLAS